jgi:hypothetical protein
MPMQREMLVEPETCWGLQVLQEADEPDRQPSADSLPTRAPGASSVGETRSECRESISTGEPGFTEPLHRRSPIVRVDFSGAYIDAPAAAAGASASERMPETAADRLHFSVTSPPILAPRQCYDVDVWAHLESQRDEVLRRARREAPTGQIRVKSKGPVKVARGTTLTVRLKINGLQIDPPQDTILWDGEIGNASFQVAVPENCSEGQRAGCATLHVAGLCIARVNFTVEIGAQHAAKEQLAVHERRFRKAFASYASKDYQAVLGRVQGMQKASPQLDVFYAEHSLRSGEFFEERLAQEIATCDVFYLFWSQAARDSTWVEWEWRRALETRGLEIIDPVPLVSPKEVPPPEELASRHFNDWQVAYSSWTAANN